MRSNDTFIMLPGKRRFTWTFLNVKLNLKKYFSFSFFAIEDQILSSTEGLVDERYLDDLFNLAIPRLINVIRKIMVKNRTIIFLK